MRQRLYLGIVLGVFVNCVGEPPGSTGLDVLGSGDIRVLDLTHALDATSPYWPRPGGNPFVHDTLARHDDGAPSMAAYTTPEHHGTHLDAPVHSAMGQVSVDQLTPRDLIGPAAVIDMAANAEADPDYVLTTQDIRDWEAMHGAIPAGAIVLLSTGWSRRWNDTLAYRNVGDDGRMHFPGFSGDAARFLVQERDIRGIGIDNLSVDAGAADGFPVHGVVNGAGKFHLENVANVHQLPAVGSYLVVAPIKIAGGSGGQVRIFAFLPQDG